MYEVDIWGWPGAPGLLSAMCTPFYSGPHDLWGVPGQQHQEARSRAFLREHRERVAREQVSGHRGAAPDLPRPRHCGGHPGLQLSRGQQVQAVSHLPAIPPPDLHSWHRSVASWTWQLNIVHLSAKLSAQWRVSRCQYAPCLCLGDNYSVKHEPGVGGGIRFELWNRTIGTKTKNSL